MKSINNKNATLKKIFICKNDCEYSFLYYHWDALIQFLLYGVEFFLLISIFHLFSSYFYFILRTYLKRNWMSASFKSSSIVLQLSLTNLIYEILCTICICLSKFLRCTVNYALCIRFWILKSYFFCVRCVRCIWVTLWKEI